MVCSTNTCSPKKVDISGVHVLCQFLPLYMNQYCLEFNRAGEGGGGGGGSDVMETVIIAYRVLSALMVHLLDTSCEKAMPGDGANKWILHLVGGAWCSTAEECYERSFTPFGSSKETGQSPLSGLACFRAVRLSTLTSTTGMLLP